MFTFAYPPARRFVVAGTTLVTLIIVPGCADSAFAPREEPEGEIARIGVASAIASTGPVVPVDEDAGPLQLGKLVQLVAMDALGNPVAARWASSDTTVLTVSGDGVALGVGAGSATITASTRTQSVSAALETARPIPVAPMQGTYVSPGDDIQAKVDASPEGTTFILRAGVHRLQRVLPKSDQSFIGEPGAVLSGARLLTRFVREGSYWVATGQTQQEPVAGNKFCLPRNERCGYPEQLFFDDTPLLHVASLSAVGPGKWFFDYAADRIYFSDDPSGRKVEASVTRSAFTGLAQNVTIRGLTIEKYSSPTQQAAVHPYDGMVAAHGGIAAGWVVENNLIRWNHGAGIRLASGMRVRNNRVLSNGQIGITGTGEDVLLEANEIAYNNTAGVDWTWEAGGTKFVITDRLVVRGNHVHHNRGPGIWTDIDNIRTLYEGNLVEDNENMGIFHEISYAAVIRDNIVRRNGFAYPGGLVGAGIYVAGSSDVEVYGNTVSGNADGIALIEQERGSGVYGRHVVQNVHVHHNTITMSSGQTGLILHPDGDPAVYTRNNRFEANVYHLSGAGKYFAWMNGERTDAEWRSFGHDAAGTINR